jgi:predicted metal-dependent hydrolase
MMLAGQELEVKFLFDKSIKPSVSFSGSVLLVRTDKMKDAFPVLYKWTKRKTSLIIRQSVWRNSRLTGLVPARISIKDQHSRWGSCSHKGNLNFNFRIGMAPKEVMDYVVIHELVHLKIKNHSKRFWTEIERFCPDYKQRQRWLQLNGRLLSIPQPSLSEIATERR